MVFQLVGVGAVILSRRYRNPLWFVFFLFFLLFVASLVLPPRRKKERFLNSAKWTRHREPPNMENICMGNWIKSDLETGEGNTDAIMNSKHRW